MAAPKIFVSSTCYDLHEVRHNLQKFIKDFGYEPVMSEYGDIFYLPDEHVQDACVKTINDCDMFVLIIGNNYGSTYHKDKEVLNSTRNPDSVTLREFKKALDLNIPKIIFINRFVHHDYKNYRKFLSAEYKKFFSENNTENSATDEEKAKIKNNFDNSYLFPVDSYRYVFFFLDQIHDLRLGNSYHEFENSEDIQKSLKQQWAGYLERSLKLFRDNPAVKQEFERKSFEKIDQVEKLILSLAETLKETNRESTQPALSQFIDLAETTRLEDIQKIFDECISGILYDSLYDMDGEVYGFERRISFTEIITEKNIQKWVDNLAVLAHDYRWSQVISIKPLFSDFNYTYWKHQEDVPIKFVMQLASIYEKSEDKISIVKTIKDKFEKLVDYTAIEKKGALGNLKSDEIPF